MRISTLITSLVSVSMAALPVIPAQAAPLPQAAPATAAAPDFDGDGKADLAVTVDTDEDWGVVTVFYGSGRTATGVGTASRLLARNLNGDAYTDLVLARQDGTVGVLFGAAAGLDAAALHSFGAPVIGSSFATTDLALVSSPTPRLILAANHYGERGKLVSYPLGSDGLPSATPTVLRPGSGKLPSLGTKGAYVQSLASSGNRLFVGAPFVTVSGKKSAGALVTIAFGTNGATSAKLTTRKTSGVTGAPATYDYFGYSVAAGEGYLAVGARGDRVGSAKQSGAVQLFRISGTKTTPVRRITQASPGVPGKAERGDLFGHAVAIGTVCEGRPAVVVGGPGEVIAKDHESDGSVWIIPLKPTTTCRARQLWEGHGLAGKPVSGRILGFDVAVLRDGGAKSDQVAIGGYGSYSEGPIGVLTVWSPQTLTSRLRVEGHYEGPAGR